LSRTLTAFRPRPARVFFATVAAMSLATAGAVASTTAAVATVGSDREQIAQLEKQIAAQGARAETLVARSNAVEGKIAVLDEQIAHDRAHLAIDQRAERLASADARQAAVDAYMNAGGTTALGVFSDASSATDAVEQNSYLSAANTKLGDVLNTLVQDRSRTEATQHVLSAQQTQATATLHQLAGAQRAAAAAIASDETLLGHVKGNLRGLLAADAARADAARKASERALANRPVTPEPVPVGPPSSGPPSSPSPPGPPHSPTPGVYANPLRGISALSAERIDQGVDYSGFGPIYAIGDGVVLSTVNGGWPGGTLIAYRLTDGPANGLVVYAGEDIQPAVQIGQTVTSNTVLGQVYGGPTGIETGWSDPSGNGDTMARTYGQFSGSNSTAFGYNFSQLLQSLGAPGGVLATNPPTGTLPSGWPQW
jgi:murein DD-endopeptidase MepM/ murein hydrolase activator NlpD